MDALCRAFGAEADAGLALPATTIAEENGRGAERAHKYGPLLDAMVLLAG
jgi:hypothetical protein